MRVPLDFSGFTAASLERAAEAVERFLREYVAPHCNFQRPERFRREHMYAPDVETLLKHLWVDLRDLFQRFALNQGKAALSKVKRLGLLSPETYCALMAESGLMNDADAVLEVCRAWGMSKETEVDPITAPHAHKLRFREFLEVVGRLAMRHPAVNSKIAQEESLKRTFMAIQQYPDADSHDLSTRLKHLHELMCPPPDSDTGEKKTANTAAGTSSERKQQQQQQQQEEEQSVFGLSFDVFGELLVDRTDYANGVARNLGGNR